MLNRSFPTPPSIRGLWRDDGRSRAAYAEGAGIYRVIPLAVAVPRDSADVAAIVRWAAGNGIPLVPRGAGSAVTGSSVGPGVVVDLSRLEGPPLEIDAGARRARTSASTTWGELDRAARIHGLRLPPDPSSGQWATLGGMLSTNAAGARTVRYGNVRPWVDALAMVDGAGEALRLTRGAPPLDRVASVSTFERSVAPALLAAAPEIRRGFPLTTKNTAGYALDAWLESREIIDLVIGAEGTLGVVTDIVWRLDRIPRHRASLRITLRDLGDLGEVVPALAALHPTALELLDRTFLELVPREQLPAELQELGAGADAVLLLEFEEDDASLVRRHVGDAARLASPVAVDVATALTDEEAGALWQLRHAASPILAALPETTRSLQVIEDGCVPISRLAEYVDTVRKAGLARGVPTVIFGHAGNGHVHVNLLPDLTRPDWREAVATIYAEVTAAVFRLGGTPAGEHGDGRLRAGLLEPLYGTAIVDLFRRVKAAFDPSGIMNPGVKLTSGTPEPFASLKVGAGAVELPPDIAQGLREIERTGGYATPRLTLADKA